MKQPFSVSMSVYKNDTDSSLRQSLDSILQQTVPPSEIVIVIDGPIPSDLTLTLDEYQQRHPVIKTIWLECNVGHGAARRVGLENCTHELVAIMDSDDICVPTRFETQLDCLAQSPTLSIVGGYVYEFIDQPDNVVAIRTVPLEHRDIERFAKSRCPMNQMTVMFRKSEVIRAGGYVDWYCNEDYFLWLRMLAHGCTFRNLPQNLVYFRTNNVYSRRGGWKYFRSETKLQAYMLQRRVISFPRFTYNVAIRFAAQVLMPQRLRGYLFNKLLRESPVRSAHV
jgi:glycosyltransferase involved in cell wall biosynthesis